MRKYRIEVEIFNATPRGLGLHDYPLYRTTVKARSRKEAILKAKQEAYLNSTSTPPFYENCFSIHKIILMPLKIN